MIDDRHPHDIMSDVLRKLHDSTDVLVAI